MSRRVCARRQAPEGLRGRVGPKTRELVRRRKVRPVTTGVGRLVWHPRRSLSLTYPRSSYGCLRKARPSELWASSCTRDWCPCGACPSLFFAAFWAVWWLRALGVPGVVAARSMTCMGLAARGPIHSHRRPRVLVPTLAVANSGIRRTAVREVGKSRPCRACPRCAVYGTLILILGMVMTIPDGFLSRIGQCAG